MFNAWLPSAYFQPGMSCMSLHTNTCMAHGTQTKTFAIKSKNKSLGVANMFSCNRNDKRQHAL